MSKDAIDMDTFASIIKRQVNGLQHIKVYGTIGKVLKSSSSHIYFELSGRSGRMSCVAWASSGVDVCSGCATVLVRTVDFYPPSGRMQAIVAAVEQDPCVEWVSPKDLVLGRLVGEGLVRTTPSEPLPTIVTHMTIVTSIGSAAYHDMMQSIKERWDGLRVTVIDAPVQGDGAAARLVQALTIADRVGSTVLVCARGGGSESDLAAFNDEALARALSACQTPTICAVGHESDHCVCDAVATWRAKTPTAAIEMVVPRPLPELCLELDCLRTRLRHSWNVSVGHATKRHQKMRQMLKSATDAIFERATRDVHTKRSMLGQQLEQGRVRTVCSFRSARERLTCEMDCKFERVRQRYIRSRQSLEQAGRVRLLTEVQSIHKLRTAIQNAYPLPGRGLAMVQKNKRRIDKVDELQEGDQIAIQLSDGVAFARVFKCHRRN